MAILETIAAVSAAGQVAAGAAGAIGGLFGGGGDTSPGQVDAATARLVFSRLDGAERQQLYSAFLATNPKDPTVWNDPARFAWGAAGGSDGKITTSRGRKLHAVWMALVEKYRSGAANDGINWNTNSPPTATGPGTPAPSPPMGPTVRYPDAPPVSYPADFYATGGGAAPAPNYLPLILLAGVAVLLIRGGD